MSETKEELARDDRWHSPAPWVPEGPIDNIHVVQLHAPHMRVCFLTSDGPTKANAYLIAAAPDLLAALKHCVIERSEWLDEARAAIAKAEGRALTEGK